MKMRYSKPLEIADFGLDPDRRAEISRKATTLLRRLEKGDPEAERTARQIQMMVGLIERDLENEQEKQ